MDRTALRTERADALTGAVPLVLACLAVVLFYSAPFGLRGFKVPVADDTFFYVGAIRAVARLGLADPRIGARPAFPLLGAVLGSVTRSGPWVAALALPVAMAAAFGLAGAALAARWGLRGRGLALFCGLVSLSAVAARLVAGKADNLMTLWMIAALLAVGAWVGGSRGRVAVAALAFGAGLAEWPLALPVVPILAAAVVWRRIRGRSREGVRPGALSLEEITAAAVSGLALALVVVFAWNGTGPSNGIETLPPGYRYGTRLHDELGLIWPAITAPLFALGWWTVRRRRAGGSEPLRSFFGVWTVLTLLVLAVGFMGLRAPTYRALTLALPVALGAAAAPFLLVGRLRPRRRWVRGMIGVGLVVMALVPASAVWYRDLAPRTNAEELSEVAAAARYAASGAAGTEPVILVVDRPDPVVAFFYERLATDTLPVTESGRLAVFVGRADDALSGRLTLGNDNSSTGLSRLLFERLRPALEAGAPILAGRFLDPRGFDTGQAVGAPTLGGGRVSVLRGVPALSAAADPVWMVPVSSWLGMAVVAAAMLALLWLCGMGWAGLALPGAPPLIRGMLAPAFGAVALTTITLFLERIGSPPAGWAAWAAILLAALASFAAAVAVRRRVGEAGPDVPDLAPPPAREVVP